MKKILLSLAVIATSGAYVVAAHQFVDQPGANAAAALTIDPKAALQPQSNTIELGSANLNPALPQAADPAPVQLAPAAASNPAGTSSRQVSLAAPAPTPLLPEPAPGASVDVAELGPGQVPAATTATDANAMQALPRPRPADAPRAGQVALAGAQPASRPQGQYADGRYKGTSANAYYGRVQVEAVVQGGHVVSVNVLSYPNDRRTSRYINGQALPRLGREAIHAQSANVDMVSGATLTSNAYRQSLSAALAAAGNRNAAGGNNA